MKKIFTAIIDFFKYLGRLIYSSTVFMTSFRYFIIVFKSLFRIFTPSFWKQIKNNKLKIKKKIVIVEEENKE